MAIEYTKKLSISVMASPSRAEFFPYLKSKLGDVPFAIDTDHRGAWENCKNAWRLYDPTAEWHVVIQDDAIICDNFQQRAEEVIAKAKEVLKANDYMCSFYYGCRHSKERLKEAASAVERGYWINRYPKWGVALCMQTKYINEMIKFGDAIKSLKTVDDARIAQFVGSKKMSVFFPMPSIVDHRHGKSLVGDRGEMRGTYKFIDAK
jgi:hypothetical protein